MSQHKLAPGNKIWWPKPLFCGSEFGLIDAHHNRAFLANGLPLSQN
jgi:hypothetical protein